MSRRTAREAAFKLVFERLVTGAENEWTAQELKAEHSEEEQAYIDGVIDNIDADFAFLRHITERYAVGFTFDRIYKIDCAILLVAEAEILFSDVPVKAAVNEALELAKTYSTDKSVSFTNGVLASVIRHKEDILRERETFGQEETDNGEDN